MSDDLFFISDGAASSGHGPLLQIKGGGYLAFASRKLADAFVAVVHFRAPNHAAAASELPLTLLPPVVMVTLLRTPQEADAMLADAVGFPYEAHMVEYHRPDPSPSAAAV